jgi:cysteinyl-tRNA synthetase
MLKLYNSLTRKKQLFKPLRDKTVTVYSCGPTVYDFAHIGNFSSYIAWDLLVRYLKYLGYKTKVVKNITDVGHFTRDDEDLGEDSIDKAAQKQKKNPLDIAKFYAAAYIKEEKTLNILPPNFRPRATGEINIIQEIIGALLKKGCAYDAKDGVYFDVSKFKKYGQLSGNTRDEILAGARVEVNPNKKHSADFALWKKRVGKNRNHVLHWNSPWGDGFPGWHIECSAMALRYLGKTIDIHTGGQDNKFPHHESEIAQSEAYSGRVFSRFFLHTGLLDIEGKKMSKSLGNFYILKHITDKGFDPLAFRFWVLSSHYRSPRNFTWKGLEETSANWKKIVEFYSSNYRDTPLLSSPGRPALAGRTRGSKSFLDSRLLGNDNNKYLIKKECDFTAALDDDLNTPKATAILLQVIKEANRDPKKIPAAIFLIKKWDQVLGVLPKKLPKKPKLKIPAKVKKLLAQRQIARRNKNFQKADALRKKIEKFGYKVIDEINKSSLQKRE